MSGLIFLKPVFKESVWGGSRLRDVFGYDIPSDHTGECWGISAHKNGDCLVDGGRFEGLSLSALWREHPELFGSPGGQKEFPLLVKIIDAREDLSIQVHPDDAYAAAHENGSLGKAECWYILDCDPGTEIVIGHHAGSPRELRQMIEEGRWDALIRRIPIKKGDFFQIDPGCIHAIKGGTLLLETQQSSDITYRVYDYGRLWGGKPRELHLKQSLDVIRVPFDEGEQPRPRVVKEGAEGRKTCLIAGSRYVCHKVDVNTCWEEDFGGDFANVSILEGEGSADGVPVRKGQHFIVPADYGPCRFAGAISFIASQPVHTWKESGGSL